MPKNSEIETPENEKKKKRKRIAKAEQGSSHKTPASDSSAPEEKAAAKKKVRRRPLSQTRFFAGLAVLIATISAVLFFSAFWAFTTWAGLKMDEILYHLRAPLEGTGGGMLTKYASRCLLPSFLIMLSIFFMIVHTRHASRVRGRFVKHTIIGASIALVITLTVGVIKLDLIKFFQDQMQDSSFIEDNYVDPKKDCDDFS